jgi:hypothetical protein
MHRPNGQNSPFPRAFNAPRRSSEITDRNAKKVVAVDLGASPANDTSARIERAAAVLKTLSSSPHGIPAERLAAADCIAVVPGFKKGAAVVGVGFGKGFISCRVSGGWSAPGSITVETTSLGVQVGRSGEEGGRHLPRDGGASQAFYSWKRRYAGLGLSELRESRIRQLHINKFQYQFAT